MTPNCIFSDRKTVKGSILVAGKAISLLSFFSVSTAEAGTWGEASTVAEFLHSLGAWFSELNTLTVCDSQELEEESPYWRMVIPQFLEMNIEVSINGGTPKCMINVLENHITMEDLVVLPSMETSIERIFFLVSPGNAGECWQSLSRQRATGAWLQWASHGGEGIGRTSTLKMLCWLLTRWPEKSQDEWIYICIIRWQWICHCSWGMYRIIAIYIHTYNIFHILSLSTMTSQYSDCL